MKNFDIGMREDLVGVITDFRRGATVLKCANGEIELIMAPDTTVDLILKLVASVARLRGYEQEQDSWDMELARLQREGPCG
jgi:hypothetical protein